MNHVVKRAGVGLAIVGLGVGLAAAPASAAPAPKTRLPFTISATKNDDGSVTGTVNVGWTSPISVGNPPKPISINKTITVKIPAPPKFPALPAIPGLPTPRAP